MLSLFYSQHNTCPNTRTGRIYAGKLAEPSHAELPLTTCQSLHGRTQLTRASSGHIRRPRPSHTTYVLASTVCSCACHIDSGVSCVQVSRREDWDCLWVWRSITYTTPSAISGCTNLSLSELRLGGGGILSFWPSLCMRSAYAFDTRLALLTQMCECGGSVWCTRLKAGRRCSQGHSLEPEHCKRTCDEKCQDD